MKNRELVIQKYSGKKKPGNIDTLYEIVEKKRATIRFFDELSLTKSMCEIFPGKKLSKINIDCDVLKEDRLYGLVDIVNSFIYMNNKYIDKFEKWSKLREK